jgi:hypothetical protein
MIIHTPEITRREGRIYISSRVETKHILPNLPQHLWFCYPEDYSAVIKPRVEPFVTGLVQFGMWLKEKIEIRGDISEHLAYGLEEYQNVINAWWPNRFAMVDLYPDGYRVASRGERESAGMAFSGGADSLHTLFSNQTGNQQPFLTPIKYALFVHGLDLRLYEQVKYDQISQHYQAILSNIGVELVRVQTNGYIFWQFRTDWEHVFGGILIGCALGLEGLFSKYFIASSYQYADLTATSSSPLTDHLLSTEALQVIHHGAALQKIEKLKAISDWPLAHEMLRVCVDIQRRQGLSNCCECHKCLRARSMLYMLGTLPRFITFKKPYHWSELIRLSFKRPSVMISKQLRRAALAKRNPGLILLTTLLVISDEVRLFLYRHLIRLIPAPSLYSLKQRVFQRYRDHDIIAGVDIINSKPDG